MESIFLSGNGINTRWTNKDTVITFCTILMNRPHLILSKTPQHPAIISHPFTQDQLCGADSNFRGRYIWRPRGGVTPVHVVNMSHLRYRPETQWKNNSCAFWSRDIQSVSTHFRCHMCGCLTVTDRVKLKKLQCEYTRLFYYRFYITGKFECWDDQK